MSPYSKLSFIAILSLFSACRSPLKPKDFGQALSPTNAATLNLIQRFTIEYPSASAGIKRDNTWWILGDDATTLLQIPLPLSDSNIRLSQQVVLPYFRETKGGIYTRVNKKIKLDFEAMAHYRHPFLGDFIWAFGSGSKQPQRDSGIFWNLPIQEQNPTASAYKINLGPLYEVLQRRSQISPEKWNIEGACIDYSQEGALYLFNRLPATLIRIPLRDWFRYLEIGSIPPDKNIQIKTYTLPEIQGHPSGFSGATYDSLRHSIWFSSSVEITGDPIRDGEILGSFIGEISLLSGEINRTPWLVPEDPTSNTKTKLESLSLESVNDEKKRIVYGTVDNDKGGSQLLLIEIVFD
jgi:hypothetical protein